MVDGGLVRVADWPAALADKDVAASIKGAVYEGYEQEQGSRVGIYRTR